ncbi:family 39 glycoside hydrolase [Macrophomina phaseolina]|uniref:Family 39 glycoside hydrolase n=1 Tax=Macrophomina phaseolina TaxID=35725 RepID=A0ABQ8GGY1_9PEZI|nr:family 39 glycoside hydrolase [Macrophomina phaseolina]
MLLKHAKIRQKFYRRRLHREGARVPIAGVTLALLLRAASTLKTPRGIPSTTGPSWTAFFDTYLSANVKSYVQIGFTPLALSAGPDPNFFTFTPTSPYDAIYTGWSSPPTNYQTWEELLYQWTKHNVEKHGQAEVESWYWEVWNEPNVAYWNGTRDEFCALHDHAIAAVRRALPTARVGGCEAAGGAADGYLAGLLSHSLHGGNCATGETGTPRFIKATARRRLQQIDGAFSVGASFAELRQTPIVMGEYDRDGCAACQTPQYGYENGPLYPSYMIATFVRPLDLADRWGVNLQGALTWTFEYEEAELFNDTTYFDGFRVLATQGIDKPVLNAHRMLGMMTGDRVRAESDGQVSLDEALAGSVRGKTDVGVLANPDEERGYVLVWHYHDNDTSFQDAQVDLTIGGLENRTSANLTHVRLDEEHSNSYSLWRALSSPTAPIPVDYELLVAAGKLEELETSGNVSVDEDGKYIMSFALPIRSLSLVVVEHV